jgi:hypothetical protein
MWDWGAFDGLVNSDGSRNETYYVFRLCCRCMQGGKEILQTHYDGNGRILATQDSNSLYILGLGVNDALFVDISRVGINYGIGEYYIYNSVHKDSLVDTIIINDGNFVFFCPESALVCVKIDKECGIKEYSTNCNTIMNIYPNPFRNATNIQYQVITMNQGLITSKVSLKIYDIAGKLVKILIEREMIPGYYKITWGPNFTDEIVKIPNGIYFVNLMTGDYKVTRKLILLR